MRLRSTMRKCWEISSWSQSKGNDRINELWAGKLLHSDQSLFTPAIFVHRSLQHWSHTWCLSPWGKKMWTRTWSDGSVNQPAVSRAACGHAGRCAQLSLKNIHVAYSFIISWILVCSQLFLPVVQVVWFEKITHLLLLTHSPTHPLEWHCVNRLDHTHTLPSLSHTQILNSNCVSRVKSSSAWTFLLSSR